LYLRLYVRTGVVELVGLFDGGVTDTGWAQAALVLRTPGECGSGKKSLIRWFGVEEKSRRIWRCWRKAHAGFRLEDPPLRVWSIWTADRPDTRV
jgi:hypothetical protein